MRTMCPMHPGIPLQSGAQVTEQAMVCGTHAAIL